MLRRLVAASVVLVGVVALTSSCSSRPSRVHAPGISASGAGSGAMSQYDTDGDGVVKGEELEKAPSLKAALDNLDTNKDGGVSASEVSARVEAWQDSKVGVMSLSCTVTRYGQPVKGASVKFAPEEFLGSKFKACLGTTDQNGVAILSVPEGERLKADDPPGAACGLYLVEITAPDGSIPAKYNTQTTLGQEVAMDAADLPGITFDLQTAEN